MARYILLFTLFLFAFTNKSFSQRHRPDKEQPLKIIATYTPYHTAMGKGKGIIFRINVSSKTGNKFTVDSFFVKNIPMKFLVKTVSEGLMIESNYLVNTPESSLNKDGSINKPGEIKDEIITKLKFSPSWIIVNDGGEMLKIKIEKYTEVKQKIKY